MKTSIYKVAHVTLLCAMLYFAWLLMCTGTRTGDIGKFLAAIIIVSWVTLVALARFAGKVWVAQTPLLIGATYIFNEMWEHHKRTFATADSIVRRFVSLRQDTANISCMILCAVLMVGAIYMCINHFAPRIITGGMRGLLRRKAFVVVFSLPVFGGFCVNHQWFGADRAIVSVAHSVIKKATLVATGDTAEDQTVETILADAHPLAEKDIETQEDDTINTKLDLPTRFPDALIREKQRFENRPLLTGEIKVSTQRTDTISANLVREVGFGITNAEISELIQRGFLKEGSTLPSRMTYAQADRWMRCFTIPCYEQQVVEVVGKTEYQKLNELQRFALISFCQNLGKGCLKTLLSDPGALSKKNVVATAERIRKYNRSGKDKKIRSGLCERRGFEAGLWYSVLLQNGEQAKPMVTETNSDQSPPFKQDDQPSGFAGDIQIPVANRIP